MLWQFHDRYSSNPTQPWLDAAVIPAPTGVWRGVGKLSGANAYTHGGLIPGKKYQFRVRARNNKGWGEYSRGSAPIRTQVGPPDNPDVPTVIMVSGSKITFEWRPPAPNAAPITTYDVSVRSPGSVRWETCGSFAATKTSAAQGLERFTQGGLESCQSYRFRVRAHNKTGPGDWSGATPVTFTTYKKINTRRLVFGAKRDGAHALIELLRQYSTNPNLIVSALRALWGCADAVDRQSSERGDGADAGGAGGGSDSGDTATETEDETTASVTDAGTDAGGTDITGGTDVAGGVIVEYSGGQGNNVARRNSMLSDAEAAFDDGVRPFREKWLLREGAVVVVYCLTRFKADIEVQMWACRTLAAMMRGCDATGDVVVDCGGLLGAANAMRQVIVGRVQHAREAGRQKTEWAEARMVDKNDGTGDYFVPSWLQKEEVKAVDRWGQPLLDEKKDTSGDDDDEGDNEGLMSSEETLMSWACEVFVALTNERQRKSAADSGAISLILDAITRFLQNASVCTMALRALANVLRGVASLQAFARSANARSLIVAAKTNHAFNREVQAAAKECLRVLQASAGDNAASNQTDQFRRLAFEEQVRREMGAHERAEVRKENLRQEIKHVKAAREQQDREEEAEAVEAYRVREVFSEYLKKFELGRVVEVLEEAGFDDLESLRAMRTVDIAELNSGEGLSMVHTNQLIAALKKLQDFSYVECCESSIDFAELLL